jgi:SAM-dependent methyltransferase
VKGFVPTPSDTVDLMVDLLFRDRVPGRDCAVLDPGCGTGAFIEGIVRWCRSRGVRLPRITGVEADPRHLPELRAKFAGERQVHIRCADFLTNGSASYDYIVGNPPYVPITKLSEDEKARYRRNYVTAKARFDLYILFFEQALRQLKPNGRLVFITPEKYLYVQTAGPLRQLLAQRHVQQIRLLPEDTFGDLVTYPTITVVNNMASGKTEIFRRDGSTLAADLPPGPDSWLPIVTGATVSQEAFTLADLCTRISCGVATGADEVFVRPIADLDSSLRRFAYPTIAGRELKPSVTELTPQFCMLVPYDKHGRLQPLERLGAFRDYLLRAEVRKRLLERTCVARKPWYAFHETPRLSDILRPKILCKDIGETPRFWPDREGRLIPRHSVYYIVPKVPSSMDAILEHLRSDFALDWLRHHCQRVANGFVRLQSRILQDLPVPERLAGDVLESPVPASGTVRRGLSPVESA